MFIKKSETSFGMTEWWKRMSLYKLLAVELEELILTQPHSVMLNNISKAVLPFDFSGAK